MTPVATVNTNSDVVAGLITGRDEKKWNTAGLGADESFISSLHLISSSSQYQQILQIMVVTDKYCNYFKNNLQHGPHVKFDWLKQLI